MIAFIILLSTFLGIAYILGCVLAIRIGIKLLRQFSLDKKTADKFQNPEKILEFRLTVETYFFVSLVSLVLAVLTTLNFSPKFLIIDILTLVLMLAVAIFFALLTYKYHKLLKENFGDEDFPEKY
jgi:hypothetical protein